MAGISSFDRRPSNGAGVPDVEQSRGHSGGRSSASAHFIAAGAQEASMQLFNAARMKTMLVALPTLALAFSGAAAFAAPAVPAPPSAPAVPAIPGPPSLPKADVSGSPVPGGPTLPGTPVVPGRPWGSIGGPSGPGLPWIPL
jgi:hypothetical protein